MYISFSIKQPRVSSEAKNKRFCCLFRKSQDYTGFFSENNNNVFLLNKMTNENSLFSKNIQK